MKRCPQCNRTFSDESLSFCIADGQLLSPSYDGPETLPLRPARATDGAVTEILPNLLTPERARRIIRRNWIAGGVGVPVGVLIFFLLQSSPKYGTAKLSTVRLIVTAGLSGLYYGYIFWSSFWGYPAVWRWWRTPITKLYHLANRFEFNAMTTALLILVGLCALLPGIFLVLLFFISLLYVGLAYSVFGGGIYQFLKARKVANRTGS